MAGKGTRTQSLGKFKPFIEINSHKILFWFLLSIRHLINKDDEVIFITTSHFSKKFNVKLAIEDLFRELNLHNKFSVIETPDYPDGQSITIAYSEEIVNPNGPLIIVNPDQYIDFDLPETIEDCYIALYLQLGNKSGFVSIADGLIVDFVEKNNISNLACAGVYVVPEARLLFDAIKEQIEEKDMLNGEFFLGPAFNYIIKKSLKVKPLTIRTKYDLGNIGSIAIFETSPISRFIEINKD